MPLDFAGIKIGHATDESGLTGCTVFLCPDDTVCGIDVRGPAPGSRETALMALDKTVACANAIVLTGGSAFGLASADGVMQFLAERQVGYRTPIRPIPIVPAAVVYDLFLSGGRILPDAAMGYAACEAAEEGNEIQGNVGAGAGVTVGKWAGLANAMKGGFGLASHQEGDLVVAAAAVTNAVGDVLNGEGSVLAGARGEDGRWLAADNRWRWQPIAPPPAGTSTTLIVVATNAHLDKALTNRLSQRAHDGLAIAIRPIHTTHDGDTAFALATGRISAPFDLLANIAVEEVAEAARNAVRHATTVAGVPGLASLTFA